MRAARWQSMTHISVSYTHLTHAPADSPEVLTGKKLPWRSAAEIIDWSLPCPSIFETRKEIREKYGISAQRPLRPNTMRRVARGCLLYTSRCV